MGERAAGWRWRGKENEWEEFERCKGLNRKNEMILDKEKLPRQLFIMEYEIKKFLLVLKKI